MKIKTIVEVDGFMPVKAHRSDAGFDLKMPYKMTKTGMVQNKDYVSFLHPMIVDTRVRVQIPEGYVGFLKSKSGLNVKCGINGEGVIDSGYTGTIVVKLYMSFSLENLFKKHWFVTGEKLIQLVLLPIADAELDLVDSLEDTDRGEGGFGSSGR